MKRAIAAILVCMVLCACQREQRTFRTDPPVEAALNSIALMPNDIGGAPPDVYFAIGKPYESNAFDLSEGKRLYRWFGCESCHGDGRGGKGPAFIDGWWTYGPDMVSIVSSIRDGRPHGMPRFGEKLTTGQIWQLAGYVQSIGAYSSKSGYPGRNDDKQTRPAENRTPALSDKIQPDAK